MTNRLNRIIPLFLAAGLLAAGVSGLLPPAAGGDPLVPAFDPGLLYDPVRLRAAIEGGIDAGERDRDGNTPLHRVCIAGHLNPMAPELLESARVLIEKGANVNAGNKNGVTPLELLAFTAPDQYELAELLINSGADYRIVDSADLALAANFIAFGQGQGSLSAVRLILEKYGDINAVLDPQGWTALHYAAAFGRDDIVENLLNNGADPNLRDCRGKTALQLAVDSIRHREGRKITRSPVRPSGSELGRALQESRRRRIDERDSSFRRTFELLLAQGGEGENQVKPDSD